MGVSPLTWGPCPVKQLLPPLRHHWATIIIRIVCLLQKTWAISTGPTNPVLGASFRNVVAADGPTCVLAGLCTL